MHPAGIEAFLLLHGRPRRLRFPTLRKDGIVLSVNGAGVGGGQDKVVPVQDVSAPEFFHQQTDPWIVSYDLFTFLVYRQGRLDDVLVPVEYLIVGKDPKEEDHHQRKGRHGEQQGVVVTFPRVFELFPCRSENRHPEHGSHGGE